MIFAAASGVLTLGRELSTISKAVQGAASAKSQSIAGKMVEGMQARAPVESGALRGSIRAEPNDDGTVMVRAGGTPETLKPFEGGIFDEAVAVEYGGLHNPARPFFWPEVDAAREQHGPEVIQAAEEAAGES